MAIDRRLWVDTFIDKQLPPLPCATCAKGTLRLVDLHTAEPGYSNTRDHEDWEPSWIMERFVAFARCDVRECGEVICLTGSTTTQGGRTALLRTASDCGGGAGSENNPDTKRNARHGG